MKTRQSASAELQVLQPFLHDDSGNSCGSSVVSDFTGTSEDECALQVSDLDTESNDGRSEVLQKNRRKKRKRINCDEDKFPSPVFDEIKTFRLRLWAPVSIFASCVTDDDGAAACVNFIHGSGVIAARYRAKHVAQSPANLPSRKIRVIAKLAWPETEVCICLTRIDN
ncbi:hypothetical protein GWI33_016585 [Rhynchophorus ferrugineus]|uniref:Uncharacterized protein n=1 Tax=Rhynchophorus ferrugineus TaxID=354439 RepID=A0A834M8H7_RHYFE|nr:hypothetical protein GWI33_016585 [Rhynchophorus ferrugineus]